MDQLPKELYGDIIKYLNSTDTVSLKLTCKRLVVKDEPILLKLVKEYYSYENLLFCVAQNGYTNLFKKVLNMSISELVISEDRLFDQIDRNFRAHNHNYYQGRESLNAVCCYMHIYLKLFRNWDKMIPLIVTVFKYIDDTISANLYELAWKFITDGTYTDAEKYDLILKVEKGILFLIPITLINYMFVNSHIFDQHITHILDHIRDQDTFKYVMSTGKITNEYILNYLGVTNKNTNSLIKSFSPDVIEFLKQKSNFILQTFSGYYAENTLSYLIQENVVSVNLAANGHILYKLLSDSSVIQKLSPEDLVFIKFRSPSIVRNMIAYNKIINLLELIEKDLLQISYELLKKIWNCLLDTNDQNLILRFAKHIKNIPIHLVTAVFENLPCYFKHEIFDIPEIAELAHKMKHELIHSGFYTFQFGVDLNTLNFKLDIVTKILNNSISLVPCHSNPDIEARMINNSKFILDQLDCKLIFEAVSQIASYPIKRDILTYFIQKKSLYAPFLIGYHDFIIDILFTLNDPIYIKQVLKIILPHLSNFDLLRVFKYVFKIHPFIQIPSGSHLLPEIMAAL